jgi:hypothetical protein
MTQEIMICVATDYVLHDYIDCLDNKSLAGELTVVYQRRQQLLGEFEYVNDNNTQGVFCVFYSARINHLIGYDVILAIGDKNGKLGYCAVVQPSSIAPAV